MTVISIDWSVKPARLTAENKNDNVEWENLVFLINLNGEKWVAPNVTATLSARNFWQNLTEAVSMCPPLLTP